MCDSRQEMRHLLCYAILLTIGLYGCNDDTRPVRVMQSTDPGPISIDASISGGDASIQADVDLPLDEGVVDSEVDAVVDAYVQLVPDIGPLISENIECMNHGDCSDFERCQDNPSLCRIDLRPDIFRVNGIDVIEPKSAADTLQSFLRLAVTNGQLSLLVEPGAYVNVEDGVAQWYLGNGTSSEPYEYLNGFPIQSFTGRWRCVDNNRSGECDPDETAFWQIEDYEPFDLIVPTSRTDNGQQCYDRMTAQVDLRITPVQAPNEPPQLEAALSGYLLSRDAAAITFRINLAEIKLEADILCSTDAMTMETTCPDLKVNALCNTDGLPLSCDRFEPQCPDLLVPEVTDGCFTGECVSWADCCPGGIPGCDGIPDAYPFEFTSTAVPITFGGAPPAPDGSNRDPDPVFENPIGCP